MRFLYVTVNRIEPPLTGHDIRISIQLEALGRIGEVESFSLSGLSSKEVSHLSGTIPIADRQINNTFATQILRGELKPFFYRRNSEVLERFRYLFANQSFDYVIYSGLESAVVHEEVSRVLPKAISILDLDESIYRRNESFLRMPVSRAQRLGWKNYFPIIESLEDSMISEFEQIWVSSQIELETLKKRHPNHEHIYLIPNGLVRLTGKSFRKRQGGKTLLYVGSYAHLPNQFAVTELVTEIMPKLPDFLLEVVGRDMPQSWLSFESSQISYFPNVKDLTPHYELAIAAVLPLRSGAGTRIKVFEAIDFGLPIVSTAFGVEGIGFIEEQHYLRAETPAEFADQIKRLASQPELASELVGRAQVLFLQNFSSVALERKIVAALNFK